MELLLQGFSPDGRWGIGWHGEGLVRQRRSSGEEDPVPLSQDLHDPSIHSPSPPCWPIMGQTAAYAGRGDRLLPPKTPIFGGSDDFFWGRKRLEKDDAWERCGVEEAAEFHHPLTLVPLLANYPHSHYSPPSLGVPPSHTPFLSFHKAHKKWGRRAGVCKCSGKYIDIYFILKITYPISTLPEHLHSMIPNIHKDGGMCNNSKQGVREQGHKDNTITPKGVEASAITQITQEER